MKLEIARGVFLIGALGVASLCAAAWSEPDAKIVARSALSDHCPVPRIAPGFVSESRPDHDLLLYMFGLSQGLVSRG